MSVVRAHRSLVIRPFLFFFRPLSKKRLVIAVDVSSWKIMNLHTDLDLTPPIFSSFPLDRFTQHRYKADQAFELDGNKSPVAQYLDIDKIVKICVDNGVEAVRACNFLNQTCIRFLLIISACFFFHRSTLDMVSSPKMNTLPKASERQG